MRQDSATDPLPRKAQEVVLQRIYRPELDALRFFAFVAVYLHHTLNTSSAGAMGHDPMLATVLTSMQQMMSYGLCLFFFLSSYLITSLLQVEKLRTGTVNLPKFYLRRMLRIWPLYLLFITAGFLLGHWWHAAAMEPLRLLAMVLLAGNWYALRFGYGTGVAFHLWSISVEEQFYVLWPSVIRALTKRRLLVLSSGLCGFSLLLTFWLASHGSSLFSLWVNSFVQTIFFAAGAILALMTGITEHKKSPAIAIATILCGLVLWFAAAFSGEMARASTVAPSAVTLAFALVSFGCGLILYGFLHLPGRLLPRPLLYMGRISYGLYVFHAIVLLLLGKFLASPHSPLHSRGAAALLGLPLTILVAAISYHLFEAPFLRIKSRLELVRTRAV